MQNDKKEPWEQFLDEIPYEMIMGAGPKYVLRLFFHWLETKGYIAENEWSESLTLLS